MIDGIVMTAGVALMALSSAGLCLRMMRPRNEALLQRPPVKILDRLTDRASLELKLAGLPSAGQSVTIDRVKMKELMREEIFGQNPVIDDVIDQIWGNSAAVNRSKPLGVFMIAGPSGIGKSQFGRSLGRLLYGKQGAKQIDMASMDAAHNVSMLFGSAPDHAGGSGELSEYLWTNPRAVIVLDEFEKSNRDVQRRFLGAFDDGYFTDLKTKRRVDTTQAVFILTTNACEDQIARLAVDHLDDRKELSKRTHETLRTVFENSILSRIDGFFAYQPLQKLPFAALIAKYIEKVFSDYEIQVVHIDDDVLIDYVNKHHGQKIDGREVLREVVADFRERAIALKTTNITTARIGIHPRKKTVIVEPANA